MADAKSRDLVQIADGSHTERAWFTDVTGGDDAKSRDFEYEPSERDIPDRELVPGGPYIRAAAQVLPISDFTRPCS